MAKSEKSRITANQFDTALAEEIAHARGMNVQANMVSNTAMFALMLRKRMFGDVKILSSASVVVNRLMEDAKIERAQYELQRKEAERRDDNRVLLPGDPRFRN